MIGDLVRFTAIAEAGESMRVYQIAIDWSSGAPQRLPDIDWSTAPLASTIGVRLAHGMLRDGLRYAEVVRGPGPATRLLVFEIVTGDAPTGMAIDATHVDWFHFEDVSDGSRIRYELHRLRRDNDEHELYAGPWTSVRELAADETNIYILAEGGTYRIARMP